MSHAQYGWRVRVRGKTPLPSNLAKTAGRNLGGTHSVPRVPWGTNAEVMGACGDEKTRNCLEIIRIDCKADLCLNVAFIRSPWVGGGTPLSRLRSAHMALILFPYNYMISIRLQDMSRAAYRPVSLQPYMYPNNPPFIG